MASLLRAYLPSVLARRARALPGALAALFLVTGAATASAQADYAKDVAVALQELEKQCGALLTSKHIDWKPIEKEFTAAAKSVKTDQDHLVLLTRLLARLQDGHCEVRPTEKTKDVKWPDAPELVGAGMFWCRSGKKILIKTAFGDAAAAGIESGSEVVKVDGKPVSGWLDARIAKLLDTQSCSTEQMTFYRATHQWLAMPKGTRLDLELKTAAGKTQKRTLTYTKGSYVPWGPALPIEGLESAGDVHWKMLDERTGYVHVRRCKDDLPELMDQALGKVGGASGLILDFRANGGGGFDHEAFLGRFVPAGEKLVGQITYESRGSRPYGGPIVVIVDAGTVSAGETGSGMFKEDGRGYVIGETPTAGMSSQKTTIELPSGLFSLYVSTHSNKGRFNGGRGLEGIGVVPHELVAYEAKDLAAGVDTLIRRAREILAKFPADKVPYKAH